MYAPSRPVEAGRETSVNLRQEYIPVGKQAAKKLAELPKVP
jgi:hypothetical protein